MRGSKRFRSLVLGLTLSAPLVTGLVGCGGDVNEPGTATVSEAEKKSVASYEAEIAKEKAAMKKPAAK